MRDGLSQKDRADRMSPLSSFTAINGSMEVLLRQVGVLAKSIRYHDLDGNEDGYFDQLLSELKKLTTPGHHVKPIYNGNMEPSQALLYVFLHNLHQLIHGFNDRWKGLANWYVEDVLGVNSLPPLPDSAYVSFTKNSLAKVTVKKNTGISYERAAPGEGIIYRLQEDLSVSNISIAQAYALYFERRPDVFPANLFNATTSLRMVDLLRTKDSSRPLFGANSDGRDHQSVGLQFASPALLLREGKRNVTITFEIEKNSLGTMERLRKVVGLVYKIRAELPFGTTWQEAKQIVLRKAFNQLFHLELSTASGWAPVDKYFVKEGDSRRSLCLKFELPENFAETTPCNSDVHHFQSVFPVLKILLNRDSWLFPYVWLKNFLLTKISINTRVEGITNILFYNELGKVDNSAPFAPFGINTERGAWFTIGNYEMASKNTQTIDLTLEWQQLPLDYGGLNTHYQGYQTPIDNRSFVLQPRYLSDFKWRNTRNARQTYLFSSVIADTFEGPESDGRLSEESVLRDIQVADMPPIAIDESLYDYGIQSKRGFISFVLDGPDIGFGEKRYRELFTTSIVRQALRKKKLLKLNAPISPLVQRILLSYTAEDEINLLTAPQQEGIAIHHIHPLGQAKVYPIKEKRPIPFVYSMAHDANIILALKNVEGNEELQVYVDTAPLTREVSVDSLPAVTWYWGNGYHWQRLPSGAIRKNETRNFLTSGIIKLRLPEIPASGIRDGNGLVWLCASVVRNTQSVATINRIVVNVARVLRDSSYFHLQLPEGFTLNIAEKKLPGIAAISQITPFNSKVTHETAVAKLIRVSEYSTHRGRAVTPRDFERMTLQQFPAVRKVKCLPCLDTKLPGADTTKHQGVVSLVIVAPNSRDSNRYLPNCPPELLLDIEAFFAQRVSAYVKRVDAINPIYEEIMIRCDLELDENAVDDNTQAIITHVINHCIAPWQETVEPPVFGYTFTIQQLQNRIQALPQVQHIKQLSVIQLLNKEVKRFELKTHGEIHTLISATKPHALLVPASNHVIATSLYGHFGIEEMSIDENFVIWPEEIETP